MNQKTVGGGNSMQIAYRRLRSRTVRFIRSTSGQDMIEYALMSGFVAVAIAASFPTGISGSISTIMSKVASILGQA